jgi:hypothetical protein
MVGDVFDLCVLLDWAWGFWDSEEVKESFLEGVGRAMKETITKR